jgi:hypothetical protein
MDPRQENVIAYYFLVDLIIKSIELGKFALEFYIILERYRKWELITLLERRGHQHFPTMFSYHMFD